MPDYQAWDREFGLKNCNNDKLYHEMTSAVSEKPDDIESWWRLSRVTYQISLDYLAEDIIKTKTIEAYHQASKAYDLNANHFEANKWLANAAGKLALLEGNINEKIKYISAFIKHLNICTQKNPQDQMTLFMEGRFQLALYMLSEQEQQLLRQHLGQLPPLNISDAEAKLRRAIELNPNFIDSYITLAFMLVKSGKIAEARTLVDKGLKVELITKSDQAIAKELAKIKESIG